ncbi:MAG TPA: alanine--glyoxylate aminotransferase family protein [Terriglobales bacterium]|nr:alanine--glyoxylate aminotransferase family protein [Terriglobales bacterium]
MITTEHVAFETGSFQPLVPPHRLLFGPGPSMVHPRVQAALAKPIVGHLDPYFFHILEDVQELLQMVFGAEEGFALAVSGTGSAGMEAAVTNFVEPRMKFLVFANGYFCDRISEMGQRQRADVVRLEKPWGATFPEDEVNAFIRREEPDVVAYVHAETSTGALQSGAAICQAAHDMGALVIADCVTSLGAMPVEFDATGIDVAYSCTQKGLSCPPGLAPMAFSQRAMEYLRARKTPCPSWYLDLKLLFDYYAGSHRYHHTAPIPLFYALREALMLIAEEGVQNRCDRHYRSHMKFVEAVEAMGLEMHVPHGQRVWNLNTVRVPAGIDDAKVRKDLMEAFGIEIQGGFGPLAGKIFRIGIMGPLASEGSVALLLRAFASALTAAGYRAPLQAAA